MIRFKARSEKRNFLLSQKSQKKAPAVPGNLFRSSLFEIDEFFNYRHIMKEIWMNCGCWWTSTSNRVLSSQWKTLLKVIDSVSFKRWLSSQCPSAGIRKEMVVFIISRVRMSHFLWAAYTVGLRLIYQLHPTTKSAFWTPKLWMARSPLYRSRFLQPNTHFAVF